MLKESGIFHPLNFFKSNILDLSLHKNNIATKNNNYQEQIIVMHNLRLISTILIATFFLTSYAQISFGGFPTTSHTRALRSADAIPTITVTPDTTEEIEANQFAYQIKGNIDITKESAASIVGDVIIYRLLIHSENAKSINLIFEPITLPDNAKMFLCRPDGGEIYGAYTNKSFAGNIFATTPVSGDSIMIQCEVPIATSDSFTATISAVNTGFDQLRALPAIRKAQYCETDIVCQSEGVEDQSRATCLIIINGIRYCSGTLIATNNNPESFVLTSAHCLRDIANDLFDSTLANRSIFYFGYNTPICETNIVSTYEKSISGSTVASSHTGKDMVLLKLSQRPPVDYMTYESGWNIEQAPRGPVTCIHHPNGDLKKISISDNDPSPISFAVDGLSEDTHWLVDVWNVGITESGSSGAPLYDANGLLIGALSGGSSFCNNRGDDKFWRLNNVWDDFSSAPTDMMSVIDPSLSGITRLKGKETYENRCYPLKNYGAFSEIDEPYEYEYGYASGNNTFGLEEFAEKFTSPYSSTEIHGVSFIPIIGEYDEENPVYLRIYSGDEKPEDLVYESVVKITAREYKSKANGFSNTIVNNWSYKENYIRLDSVVTVGKTFFVSFYTDYENRDFALLTTPSETKTAFFKKNGNWEPWSSHPFNNSVGSLLINTVVREANPDGVDNFENDGFITAFPNPAKDKINFKCSDEIKNVYIYNAEGALIYTDKKVDEISVKDFVKGVYSATITTDKGQYHTKFIKE